MKNSPFVCSYFLANLITTNRPTIEREKQSRGLFPVKRARKRDKKDSLRIVVSFDSGVFIIEARVSMARVWQAWTPMIDIYPFLFSTPGCTTALLWSKLQRCISPFRLYRPSSIYARRIYRHTDTQTHYGVRGSRVLVFKLAQSHLASPRLASPRLASLRLSAPRLATPRHATPPSSPVDTAIMKIENKGTFAPTRRRIQSTAFLLLRWKGARVRDLLIIISSS